MTLKNNLLSIGIAYVMALSIAIAQTTPLPPGLVRAGASSNAASRMTSLPTAASGPASTARGTTPAPAPLVKPPTTSAPGGTPAPTFGAGTPRTAGSSLLGLPATGLSAAEPSTAGKTNSTALKFENTESSIVLMAYAAATGRTLIMAPDVPKATITLKSHPDVELTKEEYLEAIEKTLAFNGIVLETDGSKFLKVFAKGKVRTEGIKTIIEEPDKPHPELGRTISQMITFKYLAVAEGQKALEGFKKPDGLFQVFERTNTILVTDTQENINRMLEIVRFIDKPIDITDEVNVRPIKYAKAEDIKKRLEELVAESQKQQQAKEEIKSNTAGSPGITRTTTSPTTSILGSRPLLPPGLVRPGSTTPTPVLANETLSAMVSDADRGMIRGKVQVIADERSNKLIIVTRPENMAFFDKIIEVLDIPTAADIQVKIIRLQYATADSTGSKDGEKGIADILNELIGNASASKSTTSSKSSSSSGNKRSSPYPTPSGSQNLTSPTPAPAPTPTPRAPVADRDGTGKVGELSKENITILADKRINGLIVMASPTDMVVIEALIKELDVELEQVIIETVLLQVTLNDTIKTGIDWIHSSILKNSSDKISAVGAGGAGAETPLADLTTALGKGVAAAGAKYYFLFDKLDLNMVVSASKTDDRSKVLQSPVLMTVNNKEAILESTDMRYLYKGVRASGGGYGGSYQEVPDYEQRDFGVTIKVTPRISPNGNVTLTVDQKFETLGASQSFSSSGSSSTNGSGDKLEFPTISTTKLQADVSVKSGQTIMLGGLIKKRNVVIDKGIPVLKDIPLIGRYLFGSTENTEDSSELMLFLTPHVVKGSADAQSDARRRLENTNADGVWSKGWSNSELAEPPKFGDMLEREYRKAEQLKKEREAEAKLKEFDQRHIQDGGRTNLLYNKKYTIPPPSPEKKDGKPTGTTEILPQKPVAVLSSGQMRVIEQTTEPLISNAPPVPAPPPEPSPKTVK